MDLLRKICRIALPITFCTVLAFAPARAQVVPSAYGPGASLWAGAEYSNISASFPYQSNQRLEGVGAYVNYNLNGRYGLEGDARFLSFGGFQSSTERNYLVGPDIFFLARGRFRPYGKVLVGVGQIHYPFAIGDASYFALAPGAGTDYRLSHHLKLRLEYEYQMWQNSPGYSNEPKHELTPNGFNVGVAYRVFR